MSEVGNSRRRHPRKLAAWPAWVKFHRGARYLRGTTRDVSGGGTYIVVPMDDPPETGEPVEYILGVPARKGDNFAIQSITGEAQVVRVEAGRPGRLEGRGGPGEPGGLALRFMEERIIP